MRKTDADHARAAREAAATYLEEALWAEERGLTIHARHAFEDAVNAERWAVFYETRDASRRKAREVVR